jgi:hypothetical protein
VTKQLDIVEQVQQSKSAEQLIAEKHELQAKLDAGSEQFETWAKPHKARIAQIKGDLLRMLNEQGINSVATDAGTAYKSEIENFKVVDREKYFDFVAENWDDWGNEMLDIGFTKKAVQRYAEENDGAMPPGIEQKESIINLNINRGR